MNIRTLLNLVLVIVATLLALVVFYKPGLEPEQEPPPLTSVDTGQIQNIRIVQEGHDEIRLERKEDKWFITAPIHIRADSSTVKALLEIAHAPSHSHYSVKDLDLSRAGLEPPKAHLYLGDLAIAFGTTEPLKGRRYVLLENSDTVHLIDDNDSAFPTVISGTATFVNTALLPGDQAITQLQLPQVKGTAGDPEINPDKTITLRQEQGAWVTEGTDKKPSSEAIVKLIDAWQQQTARRVEMRGDKAVLATIEVQRKEAPPVHFEILSTLPRPVLARPDVGIEYHLPGLAWNTLFKIPQDTQD